MEKIENWWIMNIKGTANKTNEEMLYIWKNMETLAGSYN